MFSASGYTLTISRTRIVSVPWRNASSVSSTETWMRAAFTCNPTNADTSTKKIAGTTSDTLAPLQISISTMAAADAGPQATHHQLAPGS